MKKSRKNKDRINNVMIIAILILLLWSLYTIFKNDFDNVEKQLTRCRQECYPRQVIETLSRRHCVCQDNQEPVEESEVEKEKGDKQWQTLDPNNSI